LLRIDQRQIAQYERARTRARAIDELADFVRQLPAVEPYAVLYASNQDDANQLLAVIADDTGLSSDQISVNQIGPAVAAHVGPGALGITVIEADVYRGTKCRAAQSSCARIGPAPLPCLALSSGTSCVTRIGHPLLTMWN
jgi:hypothetical protein